MQKRNWVKWAGIVAAAAGIVGAAGDVTMLAAPGFVRVPAEAVMTLPLWRVFVGFWLGVSAIPLYIAGYWAVFERLKAGGEGRAALILALGTGGVVLGTTFHGLAASAAYLVIQHTPAGVDPMAVGLPYGPILVPPFAVLHIGLIGATVLLFQAGKAAAWPTWLLWLSPGPLIFALYAVGLAIPPIGDYLFPAAMNLAHVVFFGLLTWWAEGQQGEVFGNR